MAIVFGIVSFAMTEMVKDNLLNQRVESLRKEVGDISVQIAPFLVQSDAMELYSLASKGSSELGGRMLVISDSGIVLADSFSKLNGMQISQNEVNDILYNNNSSAYGYHKVDSATEDDGYIWVLYSTASISSNGKTVGVLLHSTSLQDEIRQIGKLGRNMLWIYIIACIVILLVSMVVSRLVTKPVQELTDTALKISSGDLESRADVKGKSELAELGQTFNMMISRLQNIDQQRSEFVSDASHELKTPLASMKILVESLLYQDTIDPKIYKEFLSDINTEIDRLNSLITDLLLISKMDGDMILMHTEAVPFTDIVQKCVNALRPIAQKRGIAVHFHILDEVKLECDPIKLRQAVNNLVDNAIKYSIDGGRVDITIKRYGTEVHLIVQDDGVGMSKEHLDHIFERFYRVDKARARVTGGTGLGLHIVRKIALLHGGRVDVKSREGQGSVFTLMLPVVQHRQIALPKPSHDADIDEK